MTLVITGKNLTVKDVEAVDVNFRYAGRNEATAVYLQKGVSANSVTITSAHASGGGDVVIGPV